MSDTIIRIAARGDGVAEDGRHAPFAVPGDQLLDDGTVVAGPHHQVPPCRHFPECGGCQLQHADDDAYRGYLVSRVRGALAQHRIETEVRDAHLSPPRSRRRATLRALRMGKQVLLGFNAEKSHRIIDIRECHILRPELFALVAPLRELLGKLMSQRRPGDVQLTLADQGPDISLQGVEPSGLEAVEALTAFCERYSVARLNIDQGFGPEAYFEPAPATITLSGVPVTLPAGAFLQATEDGEAALVAAVCEIVETSTRTADLFAGLGTFAFALQGQVYAAEAGRDTLLAMTSAARRAGRSIAPEHRDLYRRPVAVNELASFEAVVLDPPRAGAEEQVRQLAGSSVSRIAYVSCNPATFARDAALLAGGGYALAWVRPVGQFRWSTHVELVGCFQK
ncbi:MAG: class I SAM-dependent RNA methyltransferase [Sphingomicrobium sp.]